MAVDGEGAQAHRTGTEPGVRSARLHHPAYPGRRRRPAGPGSSRIAASPPSDRGRRRLSAVTVRHDAQASIDGCCAVGIRYPTAARPARHARGCGEFGTPAFCRVKSSLVTPQVRKSRSAFRPQAGPNPLHFFTGYPVFIAVARMFYPFLWLHSKRQVRLFGVNMLV